MMAFNQPCQRQSMFGVRGVSGVAMNRCYEQVLSEATNNAG